MQKFYKWGDSCPDWGLTCPRLHSLFVAERSPKSRPPNSNPCVVFPSNQTSDVDLQCEVQSKVFTNIYMYIQVDLRSSFLSKCLWDFFQCPSMHSRSHPENQVICLQTECRELRTYQGF